jgi:hypothetical protein
MKETLMRHVCFIGLGLIVLFTLSPARGAEASAAVGSVTGLVTDASGTALADCLIILQQEAQKMRDPIQTATDAEGKFTLKNVPEGDYTLHARTRDARLSARKSVNVLEDRTANVGTMVLSPRRR